MELINEQNDDLIVSEAELEGGTIETPEDVVVADTETPKTVPKKDLAAELAKVTAGMKPEEVDVTPELLGRTATIAGIKIRPITLATISLLKEINSPLIAGADISKIKNVILECAKFLLIHKLSIDEAEELVYGEPKAFRKAVYAFMETIEPSKSQEFFTEVGKALEQAYRTQVKPKQSAAVKGQKKETPPKNI